MPIHNEIQDGLFGRLAVHRRLITIEQLTSATAEQGRLGDVRLRDVLTTMGLLDDAACAAIELAQEEILRRRVEDEVGRSDEPSVVVEAPVPQAVHPGVPAVTDADAAIAGRLASRSFSVFVDLDDDSESAAAEEGLLAAATAAREWLAEVLQGATRQGASDIHVHAAEPVRMRRFGTLWPLTEQPVPAAVTEMALRSILDGHATARFERDGHVDGVCTLPGIGRFRFNVYRQLWGIDGVFRVVRSRPPTLTSLGLPASLARLTTFRQGIVLVTGPASSGKSSTMAALVHMINEERAEHVVTIEDPIEVLHTPIRCIVNQRQAGRDTASFSRALRAALREDPDVIVIGELRDRETAQLALTAAETGHLVIATLHTHNAVRTINRIIGEFPPAQQSNVRAMLSESLRAVVSQRLLPRKDGLGVVPAVELLMSTPAVMNLIRESRVHQLRSAMQTGTALGMQTLDASLQRLVNNGIIDVDVARSYAEDPKAITAGPPTPPAPTQV
jgi:twitching motility protein PilT